MPGPFELLILLVLGGACVLPVVILVILLGTGKLGSSRPATPPCPSCGGWTVPEARFCHQCGKPVGPPPDGGPGTSSG